MAQRCQDRYLKRIVNPGMLLDRPEQHGLPGVDAVALRRIRVEIGWQERRIEPAFDCRIAVKRRPPERDETFGEIIQPANEQENPRFPLREDCPVTGQP